MEIMFNNQEEVDFLMSHLDPSFRVLEWGCGGSTLEIAKRVKRLISVEHNLGWYQKVKPLLPENASLVYIQRNFEEATGHDGTLEDYRDYIRFPMSFISDAFKFDVIFIDGRARVECAKVAVKVLKEGGTIFIHDYAHPEPQYRRHEYEVVEEFLEKTGQVFALAKFKIKGDE